VILSKKIASIEEDEYYQPHNEFYYKKEDKGNTELSYGWAVFTPLSDTGNWLTIWFRLGRNSDVCMLVDTLK
jgi:hypothetical protein